MCNTQVAIDAVMQLAKADAEIAKLTTERDELRAELEVERMKLAVCGVAAMSNTDESVKARINSLSPFWSASYGDVCAAVDREMSLRKELKKLKAKLEGGVRVEVYRDRFGELRSHQMKTSAGSEATLILDDSELLQALKAKLDSGVRVAVMRHGSMYTFNNTFAPKNASLILDDGVEI